MHWLEYPALFSLAVICDASLNVLRDKFVPFLQRCRVVNTGRVCQISH
jgi:hypothetical protein